jgi:hypothetical protein
MDQKARKNHHHGLYGEICKTSTPGSNPGGASTLKFIQHW